VPIDRVAGEVIPRGDARGLARHYVERFDLHGLYVADLDAIERRVPHDSLIRSIASIGAPLWLDAGIASTDDARRALDCGATRLIVGLETLPSFETLQAVVAHAGHGRVVFSLDLRDGRPIASAPELAHQQPEALIARAADAGAETVIVLDLARVGIGSGLDLELVARLRSAASTVRLFAGGGVRGPDDLAHLRSAGCDGALVASALLDGALASCLLP
jgi:phosphoribosylformimino-5-aminoimidazole carboxamide ribotide isomerase